MTQKKLEAHTGNALKAIIKEEPIPSVVFLPPALRDSPNVIYAFTGETPSLEQNLIRIQQECDPVGLLIAIATGQPVATHTIEADGTVTTKFETLPLSSPIRERVIRTLADKVVPRLSVKTKGKKDGKDAEWIATVGGAAERNDG